MVASSQGGVDSIRLLRNTALFRELDSAGLADAVKKVTWRRYVKSTEIVPYRDSSDDVFLVGAGSVRVTIFSTSGREISYEDLGAGSMFGELAAIDRLPRTANVITLEPSLIGSMRGECFRELLASQPPVALAVIQRLAGMVRTLAARVYMEGVLGVPDRIRAEIIRLARQYSVDGETAQIFDFPTHAVVASRCNTHREAVTRELAALAKAGIIEQRRRVLIVSSIARLAALLPESV
jgi:CRP/FNR family transcriptional regulator, cyclic AMP receptor protein